MSPVGVPVVSHGRLVNYVFVTLRLTFKPGVDMVRLREKEPYFRDALVRLASRAPLNPPDDLNSLNAVRLKAEMAAAGAQIAGPGAVTGVTIVSQAPQHRLAKPPATPAD